MRKPARSKGENKHLLRACFCIPAPNCITTAGQGFAAKVFSTRPQSGLNEKSPALWYWVAVQMGRCVSTGSGSDRIKRSREGYLIPSLPLGVLTLLPSDSPVPIDESMGYWQASATFIAKPPDTSSCPNLNFSAYLCVCFLLFLCGFALF
jgi:hypothetical protein